MINYSVDIPICTYNQEKYIRQCLDGILKQKCSFRYRILIGDDCSSDQTRKIIEEYSLKYPDTIYVFYHKNRLGAAANSIFLLKKCTSRYIALCDGDDYWIKETKLQHQYDFLESDVSFSGVGSNSILSVSGQESKRYLKKEKNDYAISLRKVESEGFRLPFQTSSFMFRKEALTEMTFKVLEKSFAGDYVLFLSALNIGDLKYEANPSSVYRVHGDGVNTLTRPFRAYRTVLFGKPNLADLFENRLVLSKTRMMFWKGLVRHSSRKDYLKTFYLLLVLMFSKTDTMYNKKRYFNFFFSNIFK